jgi:hypothetical protein
METKDDVDVTRVLTSALIRRMSDDQINRVIGELEYIAEERGDGPARASTLKPQLTWSRPWKAGASGATVAASHRHRSTALQRTSTKIDQSGIQLVSTQFAPAGSLATRRRIDPVAGSLVRNRPRLSDSTVVDST